VFIFLLEDYCLTKSFAILARFPKICNKNLQNAEFWSMFASRFSREGYGGEI
jgi:hypothetical protein